MLTGKQRERWVGAGQGGGRERERMRMEEALVSLAFLIKALIPGRELCPHELT